MAQVTSPASTPYKPAVPPQDVVSHKQHQVVSKIVLCWIAAAGGLSMFMLALYLLVFDQPSQAWSTARSFASYGLGISVLVLVNGAIALCWRFACGKAALSEDGRQVVPLPLTAARAPQDIDICHGKASGLVRDAKSVIRGAHDAAAVGKTARVPPAVVCVVVE